MPDGPTDHEARRLRDIAVRLASGFWLKDPSRGARGAGCEVRLRSRGHSIRFDSEMHSHSIHRYMYLNKLPFIDILSC